MDLLKLESFNSSLTSSWPVAPVAPNTKACSFFIPTSYNNFKRRRYAYGLIGKQ